MKMKVAVAAGLIIALTLLPSAGSAQSRKDGERLFGEAKALQEKASSKEDVEKAIRKYEQALNIFEQVGYGPGIGMTVGNIGVAYQDLGEYSKAIKLHEKSLRIDRMVGDEVGEARALTNLGNVYQGRGEYAKAVEYYEQSLRIVRKLGDGGQEGQTLGNLGTVYKNLCQYSEALKYFDKSMKIAKKVGDERAKGHALNNFGTVYFDLSEYAKAAEFYEKALQIQRKIGDEKGEGQALGNLGLVYQGWGQYVKAVEYFEKSLILAQKVGDVKAEANAFGNLGNVYQRWGQYARAVEYHEKQFEICKKIGDQNGLGALLGNLGLTHLSMGEYSKAVKNYHDAIDLYKKIGYLKGEGQVSENLANVYGSWGQYAKAVEYHEKSLEICRKIGDLKSEGTALNGLGVLYEGWGQHDKALQSYGESLRIMRNFGDVQSEAVILGNIGVIYSNQKEYPNAQEKFRQGLEIYEKIKLPSDWFHKLIGDSYLESGDLNQAEFHLRQANYSSSLGRLHLLKSDYEIARQHYEKLLASAEKNKNVHNLFTAYTGLGLAYEGIDDNAKAVEYFRKAIHQTEELRLSLYPAERETFFDVRVEGFYRTAPYEGLARVLLRMNKSADSLKESEYIKARVFAEGLSKRGEDEVSGVPHEILERDSALNERLAALTKSLQLGYEKDNKYIITALEPQVEDAKQKLATHVDMLRKEYPLFANAKYPQPMDLEQTALKDIEWVLSYDVTDPGIIIYLTRGKKIIKSLFKPVRRDDLDNLVGAFRKPLEIVPGQDTFHGKLKSFDLGTGKKLSDLLLSDVLDSLPVGVPLIIVPQDCLGVLPFEMLVLNDKGVVRTDKGLPQVSGAEFFGDRNPISYNQSISALTLARTLSNQQSRGEKLLALVDPVCDPHDPRRKKYPKQKKGYQDPTGSAPQTSPVFERLPLTSKLGEYLKGIYPSQIELHAGMDAKKSVLINRDLSPYRSIVFGTHGYFGEDFPGIREPVLVLTLLDLPQDQSGFLTRTEVMGLKNLNCEVAALVACQSGLGKRIKGEGTMGMGRAFQYAGAKSVLMSLWSVSDIAAVNLVSTFFNLCKQGKDKLEALRLARDNIRQNGYDHPYYWAAFILVGEVNR